MDVKHVSSYILISHLLVSSSSVMACSPGDSGPPMLVVTAYSEPGQAAQTNFTNNIFRSTDMWSCLVPIVNKTRLKTDL